MSRNYIKEIEEGTMDKELFFEIHCDVLEGATKEDLLSWMYEDTIENYKEFGEKNGYFNLIGGVKNLIILGE